MTYYIFLNRFEADVVKYAYVLKNVTVRSLKTNEIISYDGETVRTLDGYETKNKRILSDSIKLTSTLWKLL